MKGYQVKQREIDETQSFKSCLREDGLIFQINDFFLKTNK
jgi:hypothetical protein